MVSLVVALFLFAQSLFDYSIDIIGFSNLLGVNNIALPHHVPPQTHCSSSLGLFGNAATLFLTVPNLPTHSCASDAEGEALQTTSREYKILQ